MKSVVEVVREVDEPDVVLADRFLPKLFSMLFLSSTSSTSNMNSGNGCAQPNGRNGPVCSPSPSRHPALTSTNGISSKSTAGTNSSNSLNSTSAPTMTPTLSRPSLLAQRQAPSPTAVATLQCLATLASDPAWLSDDAISQRLLPKVLALNLQDPDLFCALIGTYGQATVC